MAYLCYVLKVCTHMLKCVMWCMEVADGEGSGGRWAFNMVCSWATMKAHLLVRLHTEVFEGQGVNSLQPNHACLTSENMRRH